MIVIGLTGGIGMGKSAAASILERRGLPVIDTDELARELVEPGQPALEEIRVAFGDSIIEPGGHLRRDELAKIVFADASKREQLEAILHPRIRERWMREVDRLREQGREAAVVVIPLLFETGAQSSFTNIICTACSETTQRSRLEARGWSAQAISQRMQSQLPINEKMTRSHFVVWTEASLEVHEQQLERIRQTLSLKANRDG